MNYGFYFKSFFKTILLDCKLVSLNRDSPLGRKVHQKPSESSNIKSIQKLGGLQHRYQWKQTV
jgi:hypothetical protein